MKVLTLPVALFLLLVAPVFAEGPEATAHFNPAQIKELTNNASTPADYSALHEYYSRQADVNAVRLAEEKKEWERRAANPMIYARKYPSSVDSAKYLYQYYLQAYETASAKARRYERMAATN